MCIKVSMTFLVLFVYPDVSCASGSAVWSNNISTLRSSDANKASKDSVDYGTSTYVFSGLPRDSMDVFVIKNKDGIERILLRYYNRYDSITNIDSLFAVISACDFSPIANKRMLSFHIYVLSQTLRNKIDGYVGEYAVESCYRLFCNYPGYFYQHVTYLSSELRDRLTENIVMGLYYNDVEKPQLEQLIQKQKERLPQYEQLIHSFYRSLVELRQLIP